MPAAAHRTAAWSLADRRATSGRDPAAVTVDLDRPAAGLRVAPRGGGVADGLLGVELQPPCALGDAWVRAGDLTAVYESADGRLRASAMWRAGPPWFAPAAMPDVVCHELVVSAQTSHLEAAPRVTVTADAAGDSVAGVSLRSGRLDLVDPGQATHGAFVARSNDRSLLFLAHPDDAGAVQIRRHGGRVGIVVRLFPAAVEKGVLLRSRVVAALGPDGGSWPRDLAAAFMISPPMLAT